MSIRVLIIDPDTLFLQEASEHLLLHGYAVATAAGGEEGLRCFRDFAPAVVVTELLMPDKDGIECLLEIKRAAPHTRVLAVSAGQGILKSDFVLSLAVKLGADAVLKKPFALAQLAHAIQAIWPEGTAPPLPKIR